MLANKVDKFNLRGTKRFICQEVNSNTKESFYYNSQKCLVPRR